MPLSITSICHYAECRDLFIVMLNVIMLSVVMLSVVATILELFNIVILPILMAFYSFYVMLSVVMLSVVMLSVAAPSSLLWSLTKKKKFNNIDFRRAPFKV
jgi:hypothetical protein